jgi:nicotinate phosphoribosyltransferase
MKAGRRTTYGETTLDDARRHARTELARLPRELRGLEPAATPYRVRISEALADARETLERRQRFR